jgi:hypothetical protein
MAYGRLRQRARIVEIVLSNCLFDGATLRPTIRKPFDVLAEELVLKESAGNRTPMELFSGWLGEEAAKVARPDP